MNALRTIAFLALSIAVAHSSQSRDSKGMKPNHGGRINLDSEEENDCEYYKVACIAATLCEWDASGFDGLCDSDDGATETECCVEITTTTPSPTPAPTCLSTWDRQWACSSLDEECCELAEPCIYYQSTDTCETTSAPTTAEPTTDSPTTAEPTTSEPTTDSPTTSEPTTATPTTSEPTTSEPTSASPTTPSPVTPSPTVQDATTTEDAEIPTPSPTMHSAQKWEMLHPAYKGSDGELMWQVYYGDFSDDARFDDFRKEQQWDANVIRPIIDEDAKFERYQAVAVEAHSSSTTSIAQYSALLWALFASLAVISALVFWCRSRNGGYAKVVDTETDLLLDGARKNEVYSN